MADCTHDGKAFGMLAMIDVYSRECLAIYVQRQFKSDDVLAMLTDLFARHGPPAHIRSGNGAEFTANILREWLGRIGGKTLYIKPGSPDRANAIVPLFQRLPHIAKLGADGGRRSARQ